MGTSSSEFAGTTRVRRQPNHLPSTEISGEPRLLPRRDIRRQTGGIDALSCSVPVATAPVPTAPLTMATPSAIPLAMAPLSAVPLTMTVTTSAVPSATIVTIVTRIAVPTTTTRSAVPTAMSVVSAEMSGVMSAVMAAAPPRFCNGRHGHRQYCRHCRKH